MLDLLGDPFTRRIEPQEYAQFRVSADGELQGIGLLIANELTSSGHLRVLAPIKGGPADRAGIKPGDEVISINGEDTAGWSGDHAANILRGRGGTEEVAMKRESVAISPVFSTTLPDVAGGPGVGYVRLSQFSGNAAADMRNAVAALEDGSALFVTVAKYQTPAGTDIDHKGIRPDLSCTPSLTAPSLASLPPGSSPSAGLQANVYQGAPPARDSAWAASGPRQRLGSNNFLPGIPLDPSTEALLVQALKEDSCA
ncbi:PDZ domain-containing protein [Haematococcus lacustris]|uniref:PDZ domain-containing protein n=1 Tax=Haematococcus lacustris TaxID=44745 RepID=A0A699YMU8_HAELA|nr:PDZ domain-containing protein [Haematococcus lacustris]